MPSVSELRRLEIERADTTRVTSFDLELTSQCIEFPSRVRGLRILDIGSGASSVTEELRNRGVKVFGVDIGYRNLKSLKRQLDDYLQDPISDVREELTGMFGRNRADVIGRVIEQHSRRGANTFFKGSRPRHGCYVAGLAGELPFRDNTFDFCFSLNCISTAAMIDEGLASHVVDEALRVLKPGGELQLHPWFDRPTTGGWSAKQLRNATLLLMELSGRRISFKVEKTPSYSYNRVRIIKPEY